MTSILVKSAEEEVWDFPVSLPLTFRARLYQLRTLLGSNLAILLAPKEPLSQTRRCIDSAGTIDRPFFR